MNIGSFVIAFAKTTMLNNNSLYHLVINTVYVIVQSFQLFAKPFILVFNKLIDFKHFKRCIGSAVGYIETLDIPFCCINAFNE